MCSLQRGSSISVFSSISFTVAGVKNIVRYTKHFVRFYCIISNHWKRLSMMWRIMEIEEAVIHPRPSPRWITASGICIILHINCSINKLYLLDFLLSFGLFLCTVSGYKQIFFLSDTPHKVDNIYRAICLHILLLHFFCLVFRFRQKFSWGGCAWKRGWSMVYHPFRLVPR